jgi:hypothetical protein
VSRSPDTSSISDTSPECSVLPPSIFTALDRLAPFFQVDTIPLPVRHAYATALFELSHTAKLIAYAGTHVEVGMALRWPYTLPEAVVVDMQQQRPHALVLLVYFAVVLIALDDYWFFKGWTRQLFNDIEQRLGATGKWDDVLAWPREEIKKANL